MDIVKLSVPELVAEEWRDRLDKTKQEMIVSGKPTNRILRKA